MTDRLRVAIVGTAQIGEVHARAARRADAVVARVISSTPERSLAAAERLGAELATRDLQEVLEDDNVDVVHICTPNRTHLDLAMKALRAGKHVICEKPLAVTAEDALTLEAEAAQHPNLVATVPFVYRFYPTVRHVRALVASGQLGRVHLAHGSYLQDWLSHPTSWNWRLDPVRGGPSRAFADIGVHWFDVVEFVLGQRIDRLVSRIAVALPERQGRRVETEDNAIVLFQTTAGLTGSLTVSQVSPGRKNRLWFSVDGTDASAVFDQENPDSFWLGRREANQVIFRGAQDPPEVSGYSRLPAGHPQGYQDSFDAFIADTYKAVGGTTVDGLPSFADGRRAAQLTECVLRSHAEAAWVQVPS